MAVCGVMPVAATLPAFPTGIFRRYRKTATRYPFARPWKSIDYSVSYHERMLCTISSSDGVK